MERRRSERIQVRLKAERISADNGHSVFIENMSESGICMITAPSTHSVSFHPGSEVVLKLEFSTGETLDINCRVVWSYQKTPPDGLTNSVGMEIIEPPLKYKELIKTLH
ncbi:PilZ domain-containing protein [bacterium]|nr:MAG: PilZ domain-containing protein [bacterium]